MTQYAGSLTQHPSGPPGNFPTPSAFYTVHPFQVITDDVLIFTGRTRLGWILIEDIPTTLSIDVFDGVDATGILKITLDEFQPRGALRFAINMEYGIFIRHNGVGTIEFGIGFVGA